MKARSRRSTAQLNAHSVVGDEEGGGISFVHRRVAYTEHVKEQIPLRIIEEVNPLHIDVPQLLSFFRECCFSPTTLKPYKEKIKSLMKNFWDTQKEFLKKITRKDQKTELQNKKLDAMTKLDVILRMFIPTLLVKYVSYSAIEVFYTFLASLISMGAINW
jgi:thiamine kinase-like enzyme